jgi:hypothetical protein
MHLLHKRGAVFDLRAGTRNDRGHSVKNCESRITRAPERLLQDLQRQACRLDVQLNRRYAITRACIKVKSLASKVAHKKRDT